MAIQFREVSHGLLHELTVSAPDGAMIGVIGLKGSGKTALLRLAAGCEQPLRGAVESAGERRLVNFDDELDVSPTGLLALDGVLARHDPLAREYACIALERLRRGGTTILFASHDEALLTRLCDEIWWLEGGRLAGKGDAREIYPKYHQFITERLVEWGRAQSEPLDLRFRRGDRRAEIESLEVLGPDGRATMFVPSHEGAGVRVKLRFMAAVEDPVIGIMIRTRVGFEVYGTNTQIEQVRVGPCGAGETVVVEFGFVCELGAGEYTLTAASHDPDGTAHDWLEDAVGFSVTAERRTAGVAGLRSTVTVTRSPA